MQTTIVITPRERFSQFSMSLRSLFDTIDTAVPVIVMHGGAPEIVREELRNIQKKRYFQLFENDDFLLAPQVRNRAGGLVETKYTCFCDNDIFYRPGWLEALEDNAERNASGAVAPLTLLGPSNHPKIHHAGSEISIDLDERNRPRLRSIHRLDGVDYKDALKKGLLDIGEASHEFEYHCALVRTDVLGQIGGHDETQTKHDHLDDSLRVLMNRHKITFEKNAVVEYQGMAKFEDFDWPFFLYRWSHALSRLSDRRLGECWGARKNYEENELIFVKGHRMRAMITTMPAWQLSINNRLLRYAFRTLNMKRLERREPIISHDPNPHVPLPPPPDGLRRAGIPGADLIRR